MSRLTPDAYHRLLAAEIDRFRAIPEASLARDVAHLEGWTVQSVVGHTGWVLRFITLCLATPGDERPPRSSVGEPPVGPDVVPWFAEAADGVLKALAEADLTVERPTFTGPQPAAWWLRRATQEVAIHRWDAQSADGGPDPIDAELALDGVDEVLEVFVPNRMQFDVLAGAGETIHLHATDIADGEWLLVLGPDDVTWELRHAKGDVAARGPASDLLLLLWGRVGHDRLDTFGDTSLLDRWKQAAAF